MDAKLFTLESNERLGFDSYNINIIINKVEHIGIVFPKDKIKTELDKLEIKQ
jgi:carbamoylphosphate synthase large subunit